ncbi:hypothetical protein QJS10_CPA05g00234 [Acorus calamus]|uniref:CP12 domain-containing protein n=1 Tax=Acorus calamus TaxID=4465 RepID=A0AAV9EXY3_ACOCL|nr:hypothetical protein QJS10_CPA05g00234 [Acorus calamus]
MAATTTLTAGLTLTTTLSTPNKLQPARVSLRRSSLIGTPRHVRMVRVVASASPSTPPGISEKVTESIKAAKEKCAENAESGECAAAWDEVEELSAAASHARDKLKEDNDPLEKYCKDNPETDECRTYED